MQTDGALRRGNAESIGEPDAPLDRRYQGGMFRVAREPLAIGTEGAGDGEVVIEVEGAVHSPWRSVKWLVDAPRL